MKRPWIQSPEARATQAANRAARYAQYELSYQCPTSKYPDGRTGTIAGFMCHSSRKEQSCDACRKAWNDHTTAKRNRNPARYAEQRMITKYGISRQVYETLLGLQDGRCAVCCREAERYVVDHDHACCPDQKTCGKCIRGLLCDNCNQGLGQFQDNIKRLRAAIAYLEDHSNGYSYLTALR